MVVELVVVVTVCADVWSVCVVWLCCVRVCMSVCM